MYNALCFPKLAQKLNQVLWCAIYMLGFLQKSSVGLKMVALSQHIILRDDILREMGQHLWEEMPLWSHWASSCRHKNVNRSASSQGCVWSECISACQQPCLWLNMVHKDASALIKSLWSRLNSLVENNIDSFTPPTNWIIFNFFWENLL